MLGRNCPKSTILGPQPPWGGVEDPKIDPPKGGSDPKSGVSTRFGGLGTPQIGGSTPYGGSIFDPRRVEILQITMWNMEIWSINDFLSVHLKWLKMQKSAKNALNAGYMQKCSKMQFLGILSQNRPFVKKHNPRST